MNCSIAFDRIRGDGECYNIRLLAFCRNRNFFFTIYCAEVIYGISPCIIFFGRLQSLYPSRKFTIILKARTNDCISIYRRPFFYTPAETIGTDRCISLIDQESKQIGCGESRTVFYQTQLTDKRFAICSPKRVHIKSKLAKLIFGKSTDIIPSFRLQIRNLAGESIDSCQVTPFVCDNGILIRGFDISGLFLFLIVET